MKVTINEIMFKKMLKALKGSTANRYVSRPSLEYIRIQVESGKITATACDGYSGARFKFNTNSHDGEDFTCLIKPINFKASKSGGLEVTIELADNVATLETPAEYGNITYHFKQDFVWDAKLDEIFDKMKIHDITSCRSIFEARRFHPLLAFHLLSKLKKVLFLNRQRACQPRSVFRFYKHLFWR